MSHPLILTGFTYVSPDEVVDEVLFTVRVDDASGVYRDWEQQEDTVLTRIPGTNRIYVESLGYGPATVTWTLLFDQANDFYRLTRLQGQLGTLKVLANSQSLKGEAVTDHLLGFDYELLDNTRIAAIGQSPHFVDGSVEVDVTFMRAVDPVTRLAVVE